MLGNRVLPPAVPWGAVFASDVNSVNVTDGAYSQLHPVLHAPVTQVVSALPAGEVLGFENLVFSIFEFVHALLENSKFKSTVRKALPELIYYVLLYMQITEEQVSPGARGPVPAVLLR